MLIMKLVIASATLYLIHLNSDIKAAMFGNSWVVNSEFIK